MPDRFGNLAIKGRSVRHGRRFAANGVGVFDGQFFTVYLFIRRLMANAGIELDDPDSVRAERLDLRCEGFVQSLDYRDHEHHGDDSDAHTKNGQRRAQLVGAHRVDCHPGRFFYIDEVHNLFDKLQFVVDRRVEPLAQAATN